MLNYGPHLVCVCVCVELNYGIALISLTSTESHSSQLNHGNRLYGQNAVLAVCAWTCVHMQAFVCVTAEMPLMNITAWACVGEREISVWVSEKKTLLLVWFISDSFYLHQETISPAAMQLRVQNLNPCTHIHTYKSYLAQRTQKRQIYTAYTATHRCACISSHPCCIYNPFTLTFHCNKTVAIFVCISVERSVQSKSTCVAGRQQGLMFPITAAQFLYFSGQELKV